MQREAQRARQPRVSEAGLTLAEMLMAMLIIGLIFAAAAAALTNLSRASVNSERRVQATALMTEIHEGFQALPWGEAVLYEGEIDILDEVGDLDTAANTWDGMVLATIESDCDLSEADCRIEEIPKPKESLPVDGRTYTVYRAITWVEATSGADEVIRRLTTIVEWEVLGRTVQERFDSERAALSEDLGIDPSQQPAFDPWPDTVPLDEDGFNTQDFRLDAVFPSEMASHVQDVEATLEILVGDESTVETLPLTHLVLNPNIYRAEVSAGGYRFEPGTQLVGLSYVHQGETHLMDTPMTFVPHDEVTDPDNDFEASVSSVSASRSEVRVGRKGNSSNYEFCDPLEISANVNNMTDGDRVLARFNPSGGPDEEQMDGHGPGLYKIQWKQGADSPWRPTDSSTGMDDAFRISIRGGTGSPPPESNTEAVSVNFKLAGTANGQCPK